MGRPAIACVVCRSMQHRPVEGGRSVWRGARRKFASSAARFHVRALAPGRSLFGPKISLSLVQQDGARYLSRHPPHSHSRVFRGCSCEERAVDTVRLVIPSQMWSPEMRRHTVQQGKAVVNPFESIEARLGTDRTTRRETA
jgi:hypothetical protein